MFLQRAVRLALHISVLLLAPCVWGEAPDWGYSRFPMLGATTDRHLPKSFRLGNEELTGLMPPQAGTHPVLGVDQIYFSPTSNKVVFVKRDVQLTGNIELNAWMRIGGGYVLHLNYGKSVIALFTEGLTSTERQDLYLELRSSSRSSAMSRLFIETAYAERASGGHPPTSAPGSSQAPRAQPTAESDGFLGCLVDSGKKKLADSHQSALAATSQLYKDPKGAAVAVASAVGSAAQSLYRGASSILDPVAVYQNIKTGWNNTRQVVAELNNHIKSLTSLYIPEIRKEIVCRLLVDFSAEGLLGVAMAATGGGAILAVAKIANFMKSFTAKIKGLADSLKAINQMNALSPTERGGIARQILASADPQETARKEVARLRAMMPPEKEKILASAGAMSDAQRIGAAEDAIRQVSRRELTQEQRSALIEAHQVGGRGRDYDYSLPELREKQQILKAAGFSDAEAQVLMRKGIAGGSGPGVSGEVHFASKAAGGKFTKPLAAEDALMRDTSTEMRAEARSYYKSEGQRLVGHQTDRARSYFIYSGDISEYASTIRTPSFAREELKKRKEELRLLMSERDRPRSQVSSRPVDQFYNERIKSYQKAIDHLEEYLKASD